MYESLKERLQSFYYPRSRDNMFNYHNPILDDIDKAAEESKETSPYKLKAIQYKVIAEKFSPVLFKEMPFYYEMGTKSSFSDGAPYHGGRHPGGWLIYRNEHMFEEYDKEEYKLFCADRDNMLYYVCGPYNDLVHYCFPYSNAVEGGLRAIYEKVTDELEKCETEREKEFLYSASQGLLAMKRVAERFGEKADEILNTDTTLTVEEKKDFERISKTAKRVPWEAPETFYEALNCLAFFREVSGCLDGVGQNAFGRPDVLLKPFYDKDIKEGRITKKEANELISKFILIWDCHHDRDSLFDDGGSHEYELSLNLGGCDDDGNEVFNEITEMFINAHNEMNCIFPKLLCRYSSKSSKEYLLMINKYFTDGRSNILLVNDEINIPALEKSGKDLIDARRYISSGCWDITVEGCEKKPCADYFNLMRPLEVCIHKKYEVFETSKIKFSTLENAKSFDEFYNMIIKDIKIIIDKFCHVTDISYRIWPDIFPNPLFSVCMTGCIEKRRDFMAGGSKYSPGTLYFTFFSNLVNSLLAIKDVCFDKKLYSIEETFEAMRNNWIGYESVREKMMNAPFFGDEGTESALITKRLHNDLCTYVESKRNALNNRYDVGYLCYGEYMLWGLGMKATPDGRKDGEYMAHGIEPTRYRRIESPSALINSVSEIDFERCAGCSCMNVVLPANMTTDNLDTFERAIAKSGIQTIQINCVNKEDLLDAQIHPEKHENLIVRICGFSAKFTSLSKRWQDEFISRNFYSA